MKARFIILAGILLVLALFVFVELPIVAGRGTTDARAEIAELEEIPISGKALFISDLHLRAQQRREIVMDAKGAETIVILGDFFDSTGDFLQFGETREERIQGGLNEFLPEGFQGTVYFVSARSHDPNLEPFRFERNGVSFAYVGNYAKFRVEGTSVVGLHGNDLSDGWIGGGIAWLGNKLKFSVPLERFGRKRFGLDEETWLIAGHSHVPGFAEKSRAANTGSFAGVPFNWFFQVHVGTGVLVDGEGVSLVWFDHHTPIYSP